jgi:hypothetical protein
VLNYHINKKALRKNARFKHGLPRAACLRRLASSCCHKGRLHERLSWRWQEQLKAHLLVQSNGSVSTRLDGRFAPGRTVRSSNENFSGVLPNFFRFPFLFR